MVNIAIIDTGVEQSHPMLFGAYFSGIFITKDSKGKIVVGQDYTDDAGHGTAVTSIIYKHNKDVNFFVVRLFCKKQYVADEEMLLYALNYVYEKVPCDLLNLSLGYTNCLDKNSLYNICHKIRDKGTFIVSAFDNYCSLSFPASFDNVIGVACSEKVLKTDQYEYVENSEINIMAKGDTQRVAWIDKNYITTEGSSFACAHATGIISLILRENIKISEKELDRILRKNAVYTYQGTKERKNAVPPVLKEKRGVIFPFNKEMHAVIRYVDLLEFDLVDVYDIKYTLHLGLSTNALLKINGSKDYKIRNIEQLDYDSFDVFVLGHTDKLFSVSEKEDMLKELVCSLLKNDKFIFSFDDLRYLDLNEEIEDAYDKIFTPQVTQEYLPQNRFGFMHYIPIPTLLVCGTSPRQGKFSLQLEIRRRLLERGIKLGQIGTEPSAFLFGMDDCFHYGYNHSTTLKGHDTIQYINNSMYDISECGKEIILSGCQSAMLVREENYLFTYPLEQHSYLLGFQPDAIVLCVNMFDDIKFITRTISYLEGAVECKVIALVLYPQIYTSPLSGIVLSDAKSESIDETKERFSEKTGLKVFTLGDFGDMKELVASVIRFFSE